jgi:hypothetical protein
MMKGAAVFAVRNRGAAEGVVSPLKVRETRTLHISAGERSMTGYASLMDARLAPQLPATSAIDNFRPQSHPRHQAMEFAF